MKFTPKGLSVSARTFATSSAMRSTGTCVPPITPSPPAFDTAAASSARAPEPKPTFQMG